jgi:uncharacterized phiE125 gp8 family phage protein
VVTLISAAPLEGPSILPDDLIEQYVKPGGGQEALLDAFRLTALEWVERHTCHSLARRTFVAVLDSFAASVRLPREPARSITELSYIDVAGQPIVGTDLFQLVNGNVLLSVGLSLPRTVDRRDAITVTFEAGYDDLAVEAPALQIAALMIVKHLFDGGSLSDVPATVVMLLDGQFRTPVLAP